VLIGKVPKDEHLLPPDAHRASTAEVETAGASLFHGPSDPVAATDPATGSSWPGDPGSEPRPNPKSARRRCTVAKADGTRCAASAQNGKLICIFHDPDRAEQAAAARRLGGEHRRRVRATGLPIDFNGLSTAGEIRIILETAVRDVLELEPSIPRSRVLIAAALAALRLYEITDLASEIKILQTAYRAAGLVPDPGPIAIDPREADLPEVDG